MDRNRDTQAGPEVADSATPETPQATPGALPELKHRKRHIRELRHGIDRGIEQFEHWVWRHGLGPPGVDRTHPRDWDRPGSSWHWDKVQSYADAGCPHSAAALVQFNRMVAVLAEFAETAPDNHPLQTDAERRRAMRESREEAEAAQAAREANPQPIDLPSFASVVAAFKRGRL